jgi:SP family general alpha glucoside:H+ symporter-like MFS transporter
MPFIIQWVWVLPLFLIVFFAPSSPWWLVRKGRLEEAERSVMRLTNPEVYSAQDAKNTIAMMVHTNELEKQAAAGTTYFDCFKGTDRRRTEIVMMTFAMQLLSGQNLIGQGVQFLQTAGISTGTAFSLNMVLNSMFIIGTIVSWGRAYTLMFRVFGRRVLTPFASAHCPRSPDTIHLWDDDHGCRSPHHWWSRIRWHAIIHLGDWFYAHRT